MKIQIKYTNIEHSDALQKYAEEKVGGAVQKIVHEDALGGAICDIELQRETGMEEGETCRAEVTLEVEGKVYRVEKTEPNINKAIDKVKDDITQVLRKDKEQKKDAFIKGAQDAKKMLRGE